MRKVVLLCLKSVAVTLKETKSESSESSSEDSVSEPDDDEQGAGGCSDSDRNDMVIIQRSIKEVFVQTELFVQNSGGSAGDGHFGRAVVNLFADQDDALVETMLCLLDVYTGFLGEKIRVLGGKLRFSVGY